MSEAFPLPEPETPHKAKPRGSSARLPETVKRAICAAAAQGELKQDIAQRFNIHRNTVSTVVKSVRDTVKDSVFSSDWRTIQQNKAVTAVNAGLDCTDDPYKRGALGVQALKGLGVYTPDNVQQVSVMFASVPKELEEEYPVDMEP